MVEPEASVSSGVTTAVAETRTAGVTSSTGTVTFHDSPGSSCGGASSSPAWAVNQPNGPATDATCWADTIALPVLWSV